MAEVFSPCLQLSWCCKLALMLFVLKGKSLSRSGRAVHLYTLKKRTPLLVPLLSELGHFSAHQPESGLRRKERGKLSSGSGERLTKRWLLDYL